ncbi:MAG: DUF3857 domain-containing protein [Bacteroidota bacterium]
MKKVLFLFFVNVLLLASFSFTNPAVSGAYSTLLIPDQLLKNANAVVRMDKSVFDLKSPKEAIFTRKYAITILNENADEHAHFQEFYDKMRKIASIKGAIYDQHGKQVKKIKKKDIIDISAVSSGSLYEDARLKGIKVVHNTYPFTVEFEYQIKYSGLLIYPPWGPVIDYQVAVQQSSYQAIISPSMDFRYKSSNLAIEPNITNTNGKKFYEWNLTDYPAMKREPYSPMSRRIFPLVYLSPNDFVYDGYQGNMETWKRYGKWVYDLADGRAELDSETATKIKELVAPAKNDEERVKILYEYLQSKSRYISIQLGIGGLQPFAARTVDELGYGDCKALSNYMRAILQVAGIKSYHATVGAGRGHTSIEPDFPFKGYTNHMILCVPLEGDTIWLECTDQNQPFGFLGTFTDDRNALLITEEGGKIVRTTHYHQSINTQLRNALVKIDAKGNAQINVATKYRGLQYENVQHQFLNNEKEQKEALYEGLDVANLKIEKFSYTQVKDRIPEATELLDLEIDNYASVSGTRIFIPLNILNKWKKAPRKVRNRKTEVVLGMEYIDTDEVIYEIPDNYKIEHFPEAISLDSDFGSYKVTVVQDDRKVIYKRTIKMNKAAYAPERYKDFLKFYKKIVRADKMKLVLVESKT